jgi:hypothetical protein
MARRNSEDPTTLPVNERFLRQVQSQLDILMKLRDYGLGKPLGVDNIEFVTGSYLALLKSEDGRAIVFRWLGDINFELDDIDQAIPGLHDMTSGQAVNLRRRVVDVLIDLKFRLQDRGYH